MHLPQRSLHRCATCFPSAWLPSATVQEQAGITYRQLDYWVRLEFLRPEIHQGRDRWWPPREVEIATRMGRLVAAGLSVERAAVFARDDWPRGEIAPGITLEATP